MSGRLSEYRVSVVGVEGGSGGSAVERSWTLDYLTREWQTRDDVAVDAALVWWRETDQCAECEVTLKFEGEHFGGPVAFVRRVSLSIQTVARVVPVEKAEDGRRDAASTEGAVNA